MILHQKGLHHSHHNNLLLKHTMREFTTWANRDNSEGKMEMDKYINPLNDYSFGQYMLSKQIIDWQYREWDNWQKGIPLMFCCHLLQDI